MFVIPVSAFHNFCSVQKLAIKDVIIIWWAGMMRGAVSVALVYYYFDPQGVTNSPHKSTLIVATLLVVLFSTLILGALTKPLLDHLLDNYSDKPFLKDANASFQLHFTGGRSTPSSSPCLTQISEVKAYPEYVEQSNGGPVIIEEPASSDYPQEERTSLIPHHPPHSNNSPPNTYLEISAEPSDSAEMHQQVVSFQWPDRRASITDPDSFGGKVLLLWEQFDKIVMQPIFGPNVPESQEEEVTRGLVASQSVLSLSPAMQIKDQGRTSGEIEMEQR
eukprot:TRINITY_DN6431_c3_g1_i2.p1 TRINITY_DN6431_c3_g1~~TRINITY_DN6431_c3_g1_i2.p1  ORF type:complete len:276 (+),score=41.26 TRINITY_DN6431_c3_g1_i2:108-935(+)